MSATVVTDKKEIKIGLALEFVQRVDDDIARSVRHYRNKAGVLLTTLDEVVRAALDDDLVINEAGNDNN